MQSYPSPRSSRLAAVLVAVLACVTVFFPASASADTPRPLGLTAHGVIGLEAVDAVRFDFLDTDALVRDDEERPQVGFPLRFAIPKSVDLGLETAGTWEALPGGAWLWRLQIASPGAKSLAANLDDFYLPSGARLHFYAADGTHTPAPFTAANNKVHRQLDLPPVPTDHLVLELFLPSQQAREKAALHVETIAQGYRDIFHGGRIGFDKSVEKSGACNIDVACSQGNGWRDEIRSVNRLVIDNLFLCTGFLVENTAKDNRPLLATAHHCGVGSAAAQTLQVAWSYENSNCRAPGSAASGGVGNGDSTTDQQGSSLLFTDDMSDFTILELDDSPAPHNPYLAGWDARNITPAAAVGIHHPLGDEKRISFENDAVTVTGFGADTGPGDGSHLRVADWDQGTTEQGSSGSPLFDASTRRVVGELHGGLAACGNDDPDWYGRLRTAYQSGADAVLDPLGSGALFVDGREFGTGGGPGPDPDPDPEPEPDPGPDPVDPFECVSGPAALCLQGAQYYVEIDFRSGNGVADTAKVVDLGDAAIDTTGLFWFFGDDNWEVLVKVLDGCGINDRIWVFAAAATDVEYTIRVINSVTGIVREYTNPLGQRAQAFADVDAFEGCS